jgi:type III secretory pathway component EscV
MRPIILVSIALALITSASAIEKPMVFGIGIASCSEFLQANEDQRQRYVTWLEGFISGINASHRGSFNILQETDMDDAIRSITNRCKEIPVLSLRDAANSLVLKILASRHRASEGR